MVEYETKVDLNEKGEIVVSSTKTEISMDETSYPSISKANSNLRSQSISAIWLHRAMRASYLLPTVMIGNDTLSFIRTGNLDNTDYGAGILALVAIDAARSFASRWRRRAKAGIAAVEEFEKDLIQGYNPRVIESASPASDIRIDEAEQSIEATPAVPTS